MAVTEQQLRVTRRFLKRKQAEYESLCTEIERLKQEVQEPDAG